MSNDTAECGCEGHAENLEDCRYPAAKALIAELKAALAAAAPSVWLAPVPVHLEDRRNAAALRRLSANQRRPGQGGRQVTSLEMWKRIWPDGIKPEQYDAAREVLLAMEDGGPAAIPKRGRPFSSASNALRAALTYEPISPLALARATGVDPASAYGILRRMALLGEAVRIGKSGGYLYSRPLPTLEVAK